MVFFRASAAPRDAGADDELLAYSVEDASLPAAVRTICDGGVNATTVLSSSELASLNGTVGHLTTGTCSLPDVDEASSGPSGTQPAYFMTLGPVR